MSSTERVNLGLPSGTQALPAGEQCGEIWGTTVKCGFPILPAIRMVKISGFQGDFVERERVGIIVRVNVG